MRCWILTTTESSEVSQRSKNLKKWEMGGYEVNVTPGWSVIPTHWTVPYIHEIIAAEKELDHPICAYPTKNRAPCHNYPSEVDGEAIEDIGRCKSHKQDALPRPPKPIVVTPSEIIKNKERWLATNPLFQSLQKHAQNLWSTCNTCDVRQVCEKFEVDTSCSMEEDMFEDVIGGLVVENKLDTTMDHMMAFDATMKFIQMIKTFLYEKKYGMTRTNQDGILTLRMRLSTQLMQLAGRLAIDRKSRLVIKQEGVSRLAKTDLSQLLSNMDDTVSIETVTATKIIKGPPAPRNVKFIDIDGEEIDQGDMTVGIE